MGNFQDQKNLKSLLKKKEIIENYLKKLNDIKNMPKKAHPMDAIRTAVSLMGLEDKDASDNSPKPNMRKAMRIFAQTPTAVAAYFRARKGKKFIPPNKKLSYSENFFHMMFGKGA